MWKTEKGVSFDTPIFRKVLFASLFMYRQNANVLFLKKFKKKKLTESICQ